MTKSLDGLKLELKRLNRRKADLEREIEDREFDVQKLYLEGKGFSFNKTYTLSYEYEKWVKQNNDYVNPDYVNFVYYITQVPDAYGVRVTRVNSPGLYLYVPFEYLIEVGK